MWIERLDDLRSLDLAPPLVNAAVADVLDVECMYADDCSQLEIEDEWPIERVIGWLRSTAFSRARRAREENDSDRYADWSAKKQEQLEAYADGELEAVAEEVDLALARLSGRASRERRVTRRIIMATKTSTKRILGDPSDWQVSAVNGRSGRSNRRTAEHLTADAAVGVEELACRVCGCTEENGCDGGCSWVIDPATNSETDLCSRCAVTAGNCPNGQLCGGCGTIIAGDVGACPVCLQTSGLRPLKQSPLPSSLGPMNGEVVAGERTSFELPSPWHDSIRVGLIDPSPYQRRKVFDEKALEELSASIVDGGLINPITVRPKADGRYELIAGERRLRAVKLAGFKEIEATIRPMTDEQAAQTCAIENLDRTDLNAVEEAETLKVLLEVGGITQEELGQRIHRSQSWIANRLRLLELPEEWLTKVISQEIPPTQARELLAWRHRPKVLAKVPAALKKQWIPEGQTPTVAQFHKAVCQAAYDSSKPLDSYRIHFKLTTDRRKELDIEVVETPYGSKEKRAFNVSLWNKLEKEAKKKSAERTAASGGAASANGRRVTPQRSDPPPPDHWQIGDRVDEWLRNEIPARLKKTDRDSTLRLMLIISAGIATNDYIAADGQLPGIKASNGIEAWRRLREMTGVQLSTVAHDLVVQWFKGESVTIDYGFRIEMLVEIYASLGGDPQAYPLSTGDLELYDVELLRKMPPAKGADFAVTKIALIDTILANRDGWLPKEFAEVLTPASAKKSPKRKAKPR